MRQKILMVIEITDEYRGIEQFMQMGPGFSENKNPAAEAIRAGK